MTETRTSTGFTQVQFTPPAEPPLLTAGTAVYEASSLLSSYPALPQPGYITVCMHSGDRATAGLSVDTPDDVRAWEQAFPAARFSTFPVGQPERTGTCSQVVFACPFDRRLLVRVDCVIYDTERQ